MGILNCISGNSIKLQIRFFVKISPPFGKKSIVWNLNICQNSNHFFLTLISNYFLTLHQNNQHDIVLSRTFMLNLIFWGYILCIVWKINWNMLFTSLLWKTKVRVIATLIQSALPFMAASWRATQPVFGDRIWGSAFPCLISNVTTSA